MDCKAEARAWANSVHKAHTVRDSYSAQEQYWDKDYKDLSSAQAQKEAHRKLFPEDN
jgi:hypothetical protein